MQVWGAWQDAHRLMVHRHKLARQQLAVLREELRRLRADGSHRDEATGRQRAVEQRVRAAAAGLATRWLGDPWSQITMTDPRYTLGRGVAGTGPVYVRVGEIQVPEGAGAPMVVPLLGAMHLAIDTGVRDPRVAGLFQGLLTRVLAASPVGAVTVVGFDPVSLGRVFAPFRDLVEPGVLVEVDSLDAALTAGEAQVRQAREDPTGPRPRLLVTLGGLPAGFGGEAEARLLALAHAGLGAGVTLVIAQWPPRRPETEPVPMLDTTIQLTARDGTWVAGATGRAAAEFNFPIVLDPPPPGHLVEAVCAPVAEQARRDSELSFAELLVDPPWQESSADGLAVPIGRNGRVPHVLRFDDGTPHWMVGGRSGSGKTNLLLDVLAGLTVRYAPSELSLYLLDFKEGVSFTEFTPTPRDPTWIPHAVAVGVESDREYGVAVLRALRAEMGRRAGAMKRAGVTKLADLRSASPDTPYPRVLAVVDEFQVLFVGNDAVARQATALLEEIARKGRSYGVHMILASQTMSGIDALATKTDSIFGQFPMRIALAGGGGVLQVLNKAADGLPVVTSVVNTEGGIPGANTLVRVLYAGPAPMTALRHRLWERRPRGNPPPAVFVGYAPQHLEYDPTYRGLDQAGLRRTMLLGRRVDVGSPTAAVTIDATPGRNLAVVGPSPTGADVLHAAVASLARQHRPGAARFLLAPLVEVADDAVAATRQALAEAGHTAELVSLDALGAAVGVLAGFERQTPRTPVYLVLFGADVAAPTLKATTSERFQPAAEDLRTVIQQGPPHGVHVLGWWRGLSRFTRDVGGSATEDFACLVALNVPVKALQDVVALYDLHYVPRPNRALLLDRHANTATLIVPFVRQGAFDEDEL